MSEPRDRAPVVTDRQFSSVDLAFINRMTTTGQVLPSVAHEINNSLQVIAGLVEIMGLRGQLSPDIAERVEKISAQTAKAASQLRELVAFSRRDGVLHKTDIRTAAERAVSLRRYHLSRGRVTASIDVRHDGPLVAQADSQHVVQVLVNLILNAEEALGVRDVREITLTVWREAGAIYCAVSDSGPGFAQAAADRPGTPFLTTKTSGAAGLGLAVARGLIEADGGQFTIASTIPARIVVAWPEAV
jgi:C4-dicarboxylate-specific signal transduction histidine kinase